MALVPVERGEIVVARPLAWPIYDVEHNQLRRRGDVIGSPEELETLSGFGLFRDARAEDSPTGADSRRQHQQQKDIPFEDIKLQIGDTLQVQLQSGEEQARYYVKLIGYLKNGGIIITTPALDGKSLLIRDGQNLVMRAFSGKSVYAFGGSVLKAASVPFAHLHISYPRTVRGLVVRKGARVKANIIASVDVLEGKKKGENAAATIINLSTTGALVWTKIPLGERGDRLSIKFRVILSGIEAYVTVAAIIRNVQEEPGSEGQGLSLHHGVELVDLQQQDLILLTGYVYQQLLEEMPQG